MVLGVFELRDRKTEFSSDGQLLHSTSTARVATTDINFILTETELLFLFLVLYFITMDHSHTRYIANSTFQHQVYIVIHSGNLSVC